MLSHMEKFQDASMFDSLRKIRRVARGLGGNIGEHYEGLTDHVKEYLLGYNNWSKAIVATESSISEWTSIFHAYMTNPGSVSNEYLAEKYAKYKKVEQALEQFDDLNH